MSLYCNCSSVCIHKRSLKDLAVELGDVEACLFLFAFPITTNKYDRKEEDGVAKDKQKGSYSQKEMNERLEF